MSYDANGEWIEDGTGVNPNLDFPQMPPVPTSVNPADVAQGPDAKGQTQPPPSYMDPSLYTDKSKTPLGFDQTKWTDPTNASYSDPKYTAGRIISQGGTPQDIATALGAKLYKPGSDLIQMPDGSVFDAVKDFGKGGANAPQWEQQTFGANGQLQSYQDRLAELAAQSGGAGGGASVAAGGSSGAPLTAFQQQLQDSLSKVLAGGGMPSPMTAAQFEAIRQPIDKGRRTQINSAMAELANRGLIGQPGAPSGPETTALNRIESNIAPDWATALQNASTANDASAKGLFASALQTGSSYQNNLAQIALGNLQNNTQWNEFLAQFGLDRTKVENDIQNGNFSNVVELLKLFAQNNPVTSTSTSDTAPPA